MRTMKWTAAVGGIVGLVVAAGSASARDDGADALRGPQVQEKPKDASLVERDFSGRIKRLEADPVIAGLEKIKLTSEEKAACEKIIVERNAILDRLVLDNVQGIVALAGARQAGDQAGVRKYIGELMGELKPLTERGRLIDELGGALPSEKHQQLLRLTREYTEASISDRMEGGPDGAKKGRVQAAGAEFLENFGQEIKRSYERVLGSRRDDFQALIKTLSLTPEQDAVVQRVVVDLVQKTSGKPTARQTTAAFAEVYKVLDAEQRRALVQQLAERRRLEREADVRAKRSEGGSMINEND